MAPKKNQSTSGDTIDSLLADFASMEFALEGMEADIADFNAIPPKISYNIRQIDQNIEEVTEIQKNIQSFSDRCV